jgi:hypothetical protein
MALKAKLAKLDGLDETIKAMYRADGDHFILDVEPVDGFKLEDVGALTNALGRQKSEITELKDKVAKFGDLDPVTAKQAMDKLKELGTLDPAELAKERVKTALAQQQEQFNTQLSAKDAEISGMTKQLEAVLIDQAATAALAAKGGNIKLLLPHVKASARMVKTDKGFAVQVIGDDGHPRITATRNGTADMTLDQLVEEMSANEVFAAGFTSKANPGGGTRVNGNPSTTGNPKTIGATDQNAVNNSLESIAKGDVIVDLAAQ